MKIIIKTTTTTTIAAAAETTATAAAAAAAAAATVPRCAWSNFPVYLSVCPSPFASCCDFAFQSNCPQEASLFTVHCSLLQSFKLPSYNFDFMFFINIFLSIFKRKTLKPQSVHNVLSDSCYGFHKAPSIDDLQAFPQSW